MYVKEYEDRECLNDSFTNKRRHHKKNCFDVFFYKNH